MSVNETDLSSMLDVQTQKNMSDRLFTQISELIQNGSIDAGYVFPNETVLCQQLNIGRSTIREAYKALELAGYIKRSKRGTVVNDPEQILEATPLKNVALRSSQEEFLEFRLMLEEQTAASAAEHAAKKDIALLNTLIDKLDEAKDRRNVEELAALDMQFHQGVANASHNTMIIASMAAVAAVWRQEIVGNFTRAMQRDDGILDRMCIQHRSIVEAINKRDDEAARTRMREHILDMSKNDL